MNIWWTIFYSSQYLFIQYLVDRICKVWKWCNIFSIIKSQYSEYWNSFWSCNIYSIFPIFSSSNLIWPINSVNIFSIFMQFNIWFQSICKIVIHNIQYSVNIWKYCNIFLIINSQASGYLKLQYLILIQYNFSILPIFSQYLHMYRFFCWRKFFDDNVSRRGIEKEKDPVRKIVS